MTPKQVVELRFHDVIFFLILNLTKFYAYVHNKLTPANGGDSWAKEVGVLQIQITL